MVLGIVLVRHWADPNLHSHQEGFRSTRQDGAIDRGQAIQGPDERRRVEAPRSFSPALAVASTRALRNVLFPKG